MNGQELHKPAEEALSRRIELALAGLRFGSVEITVHDGRVVQIERKEKVRFADPPQAPRHHR